MSWRNYYFGRNTAVSISRACTDTQTSLSKGTTLPWSIQHDTLPFCIIPLCTFGFIYSNGFLISFRRKDNHLVLSFQGLLYASSPSQLVQLPVAICSWYKQCFDCILARDPYCAWSLSLHRCVLLANHLEHSQ